MEYVSLGTICDAFSLDGTVKIISTTTNGDFRYKQGNKIICVSTDLNKIELTVQEYRKSGQFDFVKFLEINSKEEALSFKGFELQVIKSQDDLKEGYFFYSDLRGCSVCDEEGNILGKVKEVEEFPAQITLRVMGKNGKFFFVPFVKTFIKNVSIENKTITIHLIEGMI